MKESAPFIELDHLVVAARDLNEGVAWLEQRLGVTMGPGGKHAEMGTHNRLVSLGPERFLEVIAIDPVAPAPARARWFELDSPSMRARLARGPALIHWVVRTGDIARAIAAAAPGKVEILTLSRGDYRWKIGVSKSGGLVQSGISPTVIEWHGAHPAEALPDVGCRLERLLLRHEDARRTLHGLRLAGLPVSDPVQAESGEAGLEARLMTPNGVVELRE